jgi:enoyl-CoA hydratase
VTQTQPPQAGEDEYLVSDFGQVRVLTINRPASRNALNIALRVGLVEEFLTAMDDPNVRVIVVTGAGDKAFCAGADLKEMNAGDKSGQKYRSPNRTAFRNIFDVIGDCPKPTIAAINGTAVAGGFELALACDIRLAAPGISLGVPEAKIGMGANFASVVLPRLLPVGLALEMLFTGEFISSEDAARWGLINHIVPLPELLDRAVALGDLICGNSPISVRAMKERALKGLSLPLPAALKLEVGPDPYQSEDRIEGVTARLEGRKPVWRNR